jgi:type II secretory pathway pseudopilin PulG
MDPRILGLIVILLFVLFIAALGYTASIRVAANRRLKAARERLDNIRHMENLARLRHRNLDAFAKELNILRAKKGKRGVPTATLEKIQFNLMYSIDED